MAFISKELPSFMRIKKLKSLYNNGKMRLIYFNNQVVGFYTIDNGMFQNLYIKKEFRKLGLATKSIKNEMANGQITIATTRRNCAIKRLINKLGFTFTGKVVQGKQSLLEIWVSCWQTHIKMLVLSIRKGVKIMTQEEKIILLRRLLKNFVSYDWSDGKALDHYHLTRIKYAKVYKTEKVRA